MSQRVDPRASRLTADAARRKRETEALSLRTKNREEQMVKRRNLNNAVPVAIVEDIQAAIEKYSQLISLDDFASQLEGASGFQQLLLAEQDPPITEVIQSGVVPRLLSFLQSPNDDIQYMSLWALTNIAAGQHEHDEYLIQQGAAYDFVKMLASPNGKLREQACWALGNIAGDSAALRDEVLAAGAMDAVLELLRPDHAKLSTVKTATWTMSNLCRGKPAPDFKEVRAAIPVASRLIYSLDKDVEVDALWTLVFLSDGPAAKQEAVAAETVCQRLVYLLKTNDMTYLVPAVRTIGNLMSGDDGTTQKIIDNGALNALLPLLGHPRTGVRKEACWSISNVLAGNAKQIQCAMDAGLIRPILVRYREDRADIKREAAWCIANAVSGADSKQIISFVEEYQVLDSLCSLLTENDKRLIIMTLDAVERVLQVGAKLAANRPDGLNPYVDAIEQVNGADHLDNLQNHASNKVFEKAKGILTTYFETVEAPAAETMGDGNTYAWGNDPNAGQPNYTGFQ